MSFKNISETLGWAIKKCIPELHCFQQSQQFLSWITNSSVEFIVNTQTNKIRLFFCLTRIKPWNLLSLVSSSLYNLTAFMWRLQNSAYVFRMSSALWPENWQRYTEGVFKKHLQCNFKYYTVKIIFLVFISSSLIYLSRWNFSDQIIHWSIKQVNTSKDNAVVETMISFMERKKLSNPTCIF